MLSHKLKIPTVLTGLIRENLRLIAIGVLLLLAGSALVIGLLWPAYKNPASRMYDSSLGYAALMRKLGRPFPVVTAEVRERDFTRSLLAEGLCSADPFLVPVIPMSEVSSVRVREGEVVKKGDLLLELDPTKAEIKLESAKLAEATAEAELERVRVGSAYVLAQERPDRERINLAAAVERAEQMSEKLDRYRTSERKGLISRTALLEVEREFTNAMQEKQLAELFLKMSEQGVEQSRLIASNAVKDAREAVKHRRRELADHQVFSPVSGVIERVLIREGEYNQDSGKPGFVIAAGLWFEGFFDQVDFAWIEQKTRGVVHLESYPGVELPVVVERIVPVVSFNEGGPEINRPLRPRGTGAPEWAATFPVRLKFAGKTDRLRLAPGMTGFARLESRRRSLAVPREALVSVTAGKALVHVVDRSGNRSLRKVSVGQVDGEAAEILAGLKRGEEVIAEGHWGLRDEDAIEVVSNEGWK